MAREGATACPTVSGDTTPLGFGGTFRDPVERRFVDRTITTGADAYREDHAWGLPARQGRYVDDAKLHENDSPDTGRVRKVLREPRPKTGWCSAPRSGGGRDYVQITDARPDAGGISGATLQEGKVRYAHGGNCAVYASIASPHTGAVRKAARVVRKARIRPRLGPRAARRSH